MSLLLITLILL